MRTAKYADFWRKINKRTPAHSAISSILFNGEKFLISNIHIISGQNGSGKSSLLKYLISSKNANTFLFDKVTFEKQVSSLSEEDTCNFQYTSPSWLVEENIRRLQDLRSSGQFEEYINGIFPFIFDESLLECVNYILNTSFKIIQIYEVEKAEDYSKIESKSIQHDDFIEFNDETEDSLENLTDFSEDILEGKALYIECSATNKEAGFLSLSQGEQYIIFVIYLLTIRKGRSILIDEPETYLSPLSQYRLADVLAYYSVENKIQFILATHSICFIEKAKITSTLMLDGAHNGNIEFTTGRHVSNYLRRLGYKVPKENIALFEDESAKRFFSNIARNFDADWLSSMELISLNGESDITEIIDRVKSYKLTAIYDADQRGKTDPKKYKDIHHVAFLPGTLSPEQELIIVIKKNIHIFSNRLGFSESKLNGYMRMVEGIDHHDYFSSLAELTTKDKWALFDEAFYIWANENKDAVEHFLSDFS